MNWETERYVRVYTRDTADWLALSWDAQSLFVQLLRKVDRAGILPLGRHGKRAVAMVLNRLDLWDSRIAPALDELLADGCIQVHGDLLIIPNYTAAQEAKSSDAERKRRQREKSKPPTGAPGTEVCGDDSTVGHEMSQPVTRVRSVPDAVTAVPVVQDSVTPCDSVQDTLGQPDNVPDAVTRSRTPGHHVTPAVPFRAVPAVPFRAGDRAPAPARETRPTPTSTPSPEVQVSADWQTPLEDTFSRIKGKRYGWKTSRDDAAVRELLALSAGSLDEACLRWDTALRRTRYPLCATLPELVKNWDHYATDEPTVQLNGKTGAASYEDKRWDKPVKTTVLPNGLRVYDE